MIGTVHGIFLWDYTKNVIVTGAPLSCILKQIQATNCNKYVNSISENCDTRLESSVHYFYTSRFIIALDEDGRVVCYDVDYLLPVYQFEFNGQFVLFELDKTTKRILTTDCLGDNDNRSIAMRSFLGNYCGLFNIYCQVWLLSELI